MAGSIFAMLLWKFQETKSNRPVYSVVGNLTQLLPYMNIKKVERAHNWEIGGSSFFAT